jgi:hypothetical protein
MNSVIFALMLFTLEVNDLESPIFQSPHDESPDDTTDWFFLKGSTAESKVEDQCGLSHSSLRICKSLSSPSSRLLPVESLKD